MPALPFLTVFALTFAVALQLAAAPDSAEIYDVARSASAEVLVGGRLNGSGWFAAPDGYAFTAAHVIRGADEGTITLRTRDHGELAAKVVALDPSHDLALLKVDPPEGVTLTFLPISESLPAPTETVYLFGSAYFRHEIMIRGSVARKEPTYEYLPDEGHYIRCMHISAPSPLGTSGGCWLNADGEVVGLQSAFLSKDGAGMGIAFSSVPDAIRELLASKTNRVTATLGCGLEESVSQSKAFLARFPVVTRGITPVLQIKGGAADVAGLNGDIIITHVEGVPSPMRDPVLDMIRARRPGDEITVTVLRAAGAKPTEVVVTLGGGDS